MLEIKNILICGIGGVGGYFGGVIAHKSALLKNKMYNVYFLARGPHLEQIKKKGLRLSTSDGEKLICTPTLASNNIDDMPSPDLCLICVKSYDLDDLILALKKKIKKDTIIIPLMNGIDIYERIRKNLEKSIVLPTCVYVGSHIEEPGYVIQTGNPGFFCSGLDPKHIDFNPLPIIDFFKEMKITLNWKENPYPAIWEKYVLVASFALVCAHTGLTIGEVIGGKESSSMLRKIMEEIITIANEKGIKLSDSLIEDTINFCKDYPDVKPSYQRDVEKGKRNEGDLFGAAILRMGKEFGVQTPTTASIYKNS